MFAWAIALYVGGFVVSLADALRPERPRKGAHPGIRIGLAAMLAGVFLWLAVAFRRGWWVFALGAVTTVLAAAVSMFSWMFWVSAVESKRWEKRFREHRDDLERALIEDGHPPKEAMARLGFLRHVRSDRGHFLVDSRYDDNGRTPERLSGYLFAPEGPPSVGDEIVPQFCIEWLEARGGSWWRCQTQEVQARPWPRPRAGPIRPGSP